MVHVGERTPEEELREASIAPNSAWGLIDDVGELDDARAKQVVLRRVYKPKEPVEVLAEEIGTTPNYADSVLTVHAELVEDLRGEIAFPEEGDEVGVLVRDLLAIADAAESDSGAEEYARGVRYAAEMVRVRFEG